MSDLTRDQYLDSIAEKLAKLTLQGKAEESFCQHKRVEELKGEGYSKKVKSRLKRYRDLVKRQKAKFEVTFSESEGEGEEQEAGASKLRLARRIKRSIKKPEQKEKFLKGIIYEGGLSDIESTEEGIFSNLFEEKIEPTQGASSQSDSSHTPPETDTDHSGDTNLDTQTPSDTDHSGDINSDTDSDSEGNMPANLEDTAAAVAALTDRIDGDELKRKELKVFFGKDGENASRFWRKLENIWEGMPDDWPKKRRYLYDHLDGPAEQWFTNLPPIKTNAADADGPRDSEQVCKEAFLQHFEPPQQKFLKQAGFEDRVYRSGETARNYMNDLLVRGGQLKKSDDEIGSAMIRGLPSPWRKFLWQGSPTGLEDIQTRILIAEATIDLPKVEDKPKAIASVKLSSMELEENTETEIGEKKEMAKLLASMNVMQEQLNKLQQNIPSGGRKNGNNSNKAGNDKNSNAKFRPGNRNFQTGFQNSNRSSVVCFNCGGIGHFRKECGSPFRAQNWGSPQNMGFPFQDHSQNPMKTNRGGGRNQNFRNFGPPNNGNGTGNSFNPGEGNFNPYMTNMYPWPGQGKV